MLIPISGTQAFAEQVDYTHSEIPSDVIDKFYETVPTKTSEDGTKIFTNSYKIEDKIKPESYESLMKLGKSDFDLQRNSFQASVKEELALMVPGAEDLGSLKVQLLPKQNLFAVSTPSNQVDGVRQTLQTMDGSVVTEKLALLQVNKDIEDKVVVPAQRGYGTAGRIDSGQYGFVKGKLGKVKLNWTKDRLNDTGERPYDWIYYTSVVRAEPLNRLRGDALVYDIDVINGLTNNSQKHYTNDMRTVIAKVDQRCGSATLGVTVFGIYGLSVPLDRVCKGAFKDGDRIGGLHVEWRNDTDFWGRPNVGTGAHVEAGYTVEVKMNDGRMAYWWDYGDACFGFKSLITGGLTGCSEEVVV